MDDNDSSNDLAESLRAYYASSHATAFAAVAGGGLISASFWPSGHVLGISLWTGALILIAMLRFLSGECFKRNLPAHWSFATWSRFAYGIPILMGCTWGVGGFWLMGIGDQHQMLVLICISIGAVMGSISNAVYWPAHVGFFVPVMAILSAGLAWHALPERLFLMPGALLITVLMAAQGHAVSRRLIQTLRLARENKNLAARLSERTLQLEAANAHLATLSNTDTLTGLCNRRGWLERLETEWVRALRQGHTIGMLVIDIDHFKQYNDTYGHSAGDVCIASVAGTFKAHIRAGTDLAARYGGEEFAVVLPGIDEATLRDIADRIRVAVMGLSDQPAQGLQRPLTVSLGMALVQPSPAVQMNQLFDAADHALYDAKRTGRNRVCQAVWPPTA